jgi:hypothetical protein
MLSKEQNKCILDRPMSSLSPGPMFTIGTQQFLSDMHSNIEYLESGIHTNLARDLCEN